MVITDIEMFGENRFLEHLFQLQYLEHESIISGLSYFLR